MAADKASRPAVSVVVPVYNVEGYLRECLDSLCAQTLGDLEVVCVDDGSTDGSLALIREYAARDPRIAVFTKPNSGYGASMNQGIARAHGEYIGILESDDFIEPAAFEVLYRAAKEHDAEAVKANYFYYWSKPQPKSELVPSIDAGLAGFGDPREKTGVFSLAPAVWSALYRRDFLEENGIRFLETPGASYQDASFNFKVWACARRAVFLEEAFVHYRQDNESSSVNSKEKVYCVCDEYAEMQRFLDGRPEVKERLQGILVWMKFTSYWWNYGRINDRFKPEFLARARQELGDDLRAGRLDRSLFEPWKEALLGALLKSPEAFEDWLVQRPGKINTFRRYYSTGGWPLVIKVLRGKFQRAGK